MENEARRDGLMAVLSANMEVLLKGKRKLSQMGYSKKLDSEMEISMCLLTSVFGVSAWKIN